jgi:hypothetical protein
MVRYYGYYSNVSRGKRKKQDEDERTPRFWNQTNHQESAGRTGPGSPASGGLIQRIYDVDPLTCPKSSGTMKVISVIEHEDVIEKILRQVGL